MGGGGDGGGYSESSALGGGRLLRSDTLGGLVGGVGPAPSQE